MKWNYSQTNQKGEKKMKLYQINHLSKEISPPNLCTALGINLSSNQTISFVGAGGKTTTIYTLAKELSSLGKKVIITTTTHMFLPEENGVFEENQEQLLHQLNHSGIAVVGIPCTEEKSLGKMTGVSTAFYRDMKHAADYILVEADGSKRYPIKVPAPHEPVLPEDTDMVVIVGGLSCLNQPLKECCHRWEVASKLLDCEPDKGMESKDMADLLVKGYFSKREECLALYNLPKKIYLNQCDSEEIYVKALEVIYYLEEQSIKPEYVTTGNFLEKPENS